jgi:cell division protein FtsL
MKKNGKSSSGVPLLRFRSLLLWMVLVIVLISGPLLLVWKQVYINIASISMDENRKTLAGLQKEITTLKLASNRLSSGERIERIAREKLGLEYPTTSQMYVINIPGERKNFVLDKTHDILAFFRKVIAGERG